jgi:beta-galactosidase
VTRPAGEAESVRIGPQFSWRPHGVAQAPSEEMFLKAEQWQLTASPDSVTGLSNLFLRVEYTGDVARLSQNGRLLVDDFFNGRTWEIGLNRFISSGKVLTLSLSILPIRKDAPIYLQPEYRPDFAEHTQVVDLKSATLVPQYQFVVTSKP